MLTLSIRHQLSIGLVLALVIAVTRGHHFASIVNLPDASWAIFFLAGVYVNARWFAAVLFVEAALIDFAAVTWGGASGYCISPAYVFLLPAYLALWFAGRWYAHRYAVVLQNLLPLVASLAFGVSACEILSSGGFYFFSGRFAEPTLAEFGGRLMIYFPLSLQPVVFYTTVAALIHIAVMVSRRHASTAVG